MATDNTVEILVALKDATKAGIQAVIGNLDNLKNKAESVAGSVFNLQTALAGFAAGAVFADLASDAQEASARIESGVDATSQKMEELAAIAETVWRDAYAGSMVEASDAVIAAYQEMGDIGSAALKQVAEDAKALEKRFGADYREVVNSASELMKQFGISSEQAFDLLFAGYQRGMDKSGDFLGTVQEYSRQFSEADADAGQFFSVLESGLASGNLGTDKAADLFKEFRVQIQSGSAGVSDALSQLGIDSEDMLAKLSSGTMSSADAFDVVIKALGKVEDSSIQMQAGVALLGSQFEDLGARAVTGIDMAATNMDDLAGATEKLHDQYDTLGTEIKKLWREVLSAFTGEATSITSYLAGEISNAREAIARLRADGTLGEWAQKIGDAVRETIGYLKNLIAIGVQIGTSLAPVISLFIKWSPEILAVAVGAKTLSVALGMVQGGMTLLNAAMATGSWVTYLKHVQTASTYTNLLSVATASLGNALTVAAGAVGAFFAGWQIGKLISAMDLFGLLPVTLGEVAQIAFGFFDEQISNVTISILELKKKWEALWGDSQAVAQIEKEIQAEQEHIEAIRRVVASIGEKESAAVSSSMSQVAEIEKIKTAEGAAQNERVKQAQSAAAQIRAFEKKEADAYLSSLKENTTKAKTEYEKRAHEISMAEAQGAMTYNQALQEKLRLDVQYNLDALNQARQGFAQVAKVYGEDSDEYKKALQAKQAALKNYQAVEQKVANKIKSINQAIKNSRMSAEEKINNLRRKGMSELALYKDKEKEYYQTLSAASKLARTDTEGSIALYEKAMGIAADLATEVKEGEKVVISEGEATTKAINLVQHAQGQMEQTLRAQRDAAQSAFDELKSGNEDSAKSFDQTGQNVESLKGTIGELNATLKDFQIPPVKIDADGSNAEKEISRVRGQLEDIEENTVNLNVNSAAFDAAIADAKAKLSALSAENGKSEHTVEIKGKASPEAPFSDTMARVSGLMENFQALASRPSTSVVSISGDTGSGPESFTSATNSIMAEYQGLKDKFERDKITGRVTFEGEQGNFQQSAELVKQTFSRLYSDLSAGVQQYSGVFSGAMAGAKDAVGQMGGGVSAASQQVVSALSGMGQGAKAYGQQIKEAIVSGNSEAFNQATAGLQNYGQQFTQTMQEQIQAAKQMAQEVIQSGEQMIQALSSKIQSLSQQIASIDAEIGSIGESTAEKIRQINQGLMTEHQKWLDDKLAAETAYNQAKAEMDAGNFERAKELMLKSQQIAEGLAREITDEEGNIIMSLAETTQTAIGMVSEAGAGAEEALAGQKAALEEQQSVAQEQLAATEELVDSVKSMSEGMSASLEAMMATFQETMTAAMETLGDEIASAMEEAKSAVEEPMEPQVNISPAKQALAELAEDAYRTAVEYEKMIAKTGDTQSAYVNQVTDSYRKMSAQATAEWKKYSKAAGTPISSRTDFMGKASPERPLTETIKNLIDMFSKLKKEASEQVETNVTFTGTGSPTKPLTEKIGDMKNAIVGFISGIPKGQLDMDVSSITQLPRQVAASIGDISMPDITAGLNIGAMAKMANPLDALKDFGKIELSGGGVTAKMLGQQDVIATLTDALRRDGLVKV